MPRIIGLTGEATFGVGKDAVRLNRHDLLALPDVAAAAVLANVKQACDMTPNACLDPYGGPSAPVRRTSIRKVYIEGLGWTWDA
jgi:hypothetical protein